MTVRFTDFQDDDNLLNGTVVNDASALAALLSALRGRDPFCCEFENDCGDCLLLGLGDGIGCAQYTPGDGSAVAVVALNSWSAAQNGDAHFGGDVEFLCGDTPTPMSARWILPMATVQRIAQHFIETGERSREVAWELM